jgi:HEPN domain-containing protein
MTEPRPFEIWLHRARSNLRIAQRGKGEGIFLEDLCFEAQQAAEKSIKAMLIYLSGDYPKRHSFTLLLAKLEEFRSVPDTIKEVVELTDYAVQTRYPGDYYPVTEAEYERALELAERVLGWVEAQILESR